MPGGPPQHRRSTTVTPAPFFVTPAKAGAHLWLSMPPQPAENGIDRRSCRAVQGWAPDQVRGDEMGEQPPPHRRHPHRNTAVTPAKAGAHLWLGPQPQPVRNGIDRRGLPRRSGLGPGFPAFAGTGAVRGDGGAQQPPQHYRHPRNTAVTPAKAGGHLWFGPQPQPVQNGIDRDAGGAVGRYLAQGQ